MVQVSERELELSNALLNVFRRFAGEDGPEPWTDSDVSVRTAELTSLIDGTPADGLASWSLWIEHLAALTIRPSDLDLVVPSITPVSMFDDTASLELESFNLFADRSDLGGLLVGSASDATNMLVLGASIEDGLVIANPTRQEDGRCRVVCVFHGEAFLFRSVVDAADEADAVAHGSDVINGIDHVRHRERLPLLSDFILALARALDEGPFEGSVSDRHSRNYPWLRL